MKDIYKKCHNIIDTVLIYNISGEDDFIFEYDILNMCDISLNINYDFDDIFTITEEAIIVYVSEIINGDIIIYHKYGKKIVLEKNIKIGKAIFRLCEGCPDNGQKNCIVLLKEIYLLSGLGYLKQPDCFKEDPIQLKKFHNIYQRTVSLFDKYLITYNIDIYHDLSDIYNNEYQEYFYFTGKFDDIKERLEFQFKQHRLTTVEWSFDDEEIFKENISSFFNIINMYNMPCIESKRLWINNLDSEIPELSGDDYELITKREKLIRKLQKAVDEANRQKLLTYKDED